MKLWLVRAGRTGEYEKKFLEESRIYLTWDDLNYDLSKFTNKSNLNQFLLKHFPDEKKATIRNWTGQMWPFGIEMKKGDWIVLPSKMKPAIHIAEILSDYKYDSVAEEPYHHYREIKWLETDIPRTNFDQDLLYSFGAAMTICRISRNNAEKRILEMSKNNWNVESPSLFEKKKTDQETAEPEFQDLELSARDQIAKYIIRKFKGHGMARLVEAILKAQGYTTFRSPEGPDKGIDIVAAPGPLGFGNPRLCVQVKTGDSPVDRPTLDQLIGAMQNINAEQGLLVSWGGFKSSIDKEIVNQFFRVRLWNQDSLIHELMKSYEKLDEDIRAELPLKRIWTLTITDE